jgi:hypothetical protein
MTDDLNEAIESARTSGTRGDHGRAPHHSRAQVIAIVRAVLENIPDFISVRDVLDELNTERGSGFGN